MINYIKQANEIRYNFKRLNIKFIVKYYLKARDYKMSTKPKTYKIPT